MRILSKSGRTPAVRPLLGGALVLSLGLTLGACGGISGNRSMYPTPEHMPVVEKVNYTLDVSTGGSGLAYGEQRRLGDWFETMNVKYGDKVYLDDPTHNPSTRTAVEALATRYGAQLGAEAPVTDGYIRSGAARVVVTRAKASVKGCPDWSTRNDFNPNNGLSGNYGCATNANLAAMVADPEDLLRGADTQGNTVVMSSSKALDSYRKQTPSGAEGIAATSSKDN
ncbi:CpaD family pilus assembly protein [Novosphingobium colocasiae]|uniref:Pilus assembly protein CpaD n=1 Tax=Novosphingobium colocasiae TaxID=1256513 RepID=A0A918PGM8_9SPHN|nr:CpaD family pilus assembly protein [Novosphingobium colocasiae]GGZ06314.1 hypothetical protein GCM10011614_21570 [Novosphingobium colocasiae]